MIRSSSAARTYSDFSCHCSASSAKQFPPVWARHSPSHSMPNVLFSEEVDERVSARTLRWIGTVTEKPPSAVTASEPSYRPAACALGTRTSTQATRFSSGGTVTGKARRDSR